MSVNSLDCVVIGYNELPFEQYERFLRNYGEESEAYRDLKFSFVNVAGRKLDYPGLLNYAVREAYPAGGGAGTPAEFRSGDIPNLAAVYLTNFLRRHGFRADYINLFQHEKDRLAALLAEDPACVAITTTFYVVNLPVNEMVEFIRRHNPRTKIVVGGPLIANHVRNYQGDALKPALADIGADVYVIEGAGELTLAGVVSCLKEGGDLAAVPNLAYFEGGRLRRTATRPENSSLDEDVINWLDFADQRLGRTIQTRTARSCAFKCSFCNYPTRAGALTLASTEAVERELDSIRGLGDAKNVVFIDDTFNVPLPRFKDLCRMMIRNGYGFNWFSYFRCSNSDEEAFDLMAESGCKGVFLGIESGSPAILKNMNKAATIERYGYGIDQLHRRGILTFGSFIVGFPGETAETVGETLSFIKEHKPTYYRAQSWYCEPGTPVDQQREKYGIEGEGFVWSHNTMDSLEAMDHIDRMFLSVNESLWLPQWSFDFWIIPYLIGRGVTPEGFKEFMTMADRLLGTEIAAVPAAQKRLIQQQNLQGIVNAVRNWNLK
ncbi:MAG TPA: PhpK family radical SAM P-methyltransferase [Pyrinomonadaceae bacterium]|jgi:p-methyltransferase